MWSNLIVVASLRNQVFLAPSIDSKICATEPSSRTRALNTSMNAMSVGWLGRLKSRLTFSRYAHVLSTLVADHAKRFKQIEQENARLKRLLAEAELDKAILREAA